MPQHKLAVRLESLQEPLRTALTTAATLGVAGVQLDAVGDLGPEQLSQTGRRDFRHRLRSVDLELAALGCPLRHGLAVADGLDARLGHIRKVMSLTYDLGARLTIVSAGPIPPEEQPAARQTLEQSLLDLGRHGDRIGVRLAVEAGHEAPTLLKLFLGRLTCGGVSVHVDPATLLARAHDPCAALRELHGLVAYVHARDTRVLGADRQAHEVPLGHGDVDWIAFLSTLEEIDYRGWLTLKRNLGSDAAADLRAGAAFLRRLGM